MNIKIKPDASPYGDIKDEASGMTFYFPKGTAQDEILAEVNKEMGRLK